MRAHVDLLLRSCEVVDVTFDGLYTLSSFPLKAGTASQVTSPEGKLVVQSICNDMAHIRLYEYKILAHTIIDIEIIEPSFFLAAMLEGCSVLYNESSGLISELSGNAVKLIYLKAGKYQRSLLAGEHTLLLVTINPEWLFSKYGELKALNGLISAFSQDEVHDFSLPSVNVAYGVFNALRRLNADPKRKKPDVCMQRFLTSSTKRYLAKLLVKISNIEYKESKAREIEKFLTENYSDRIVDDEAALAAYFSISTVMLGRLAKLHFGRPFHKQVTELRMHMALKLLLTSQKTIEEMSVEVGYSDPKYFNRVFKKRFGITPIGLRACML